MQTEDLLVYRPLYSLLSLTHDYVALLPKRMQRTVGDRMLSLAVDAMVSLNDAHHSSDVQKRVRCQDLIISKMGAMRVLVRLCNEKEALSIKQVEQLTRLLDSIGKQMNAWRGKTSGGGVSPRVARM